MTENVRSCWYLLWRYFKINLYPKAKIATVYNVPYTNHWLAALPLNSLLSGSNNATKPEFSEPFEPKPRYFGKK